MGGLRPDKREFPKISQLTLDKNMLLEKDSYYCITSYCLVSHRDLSGKNGTAPLLLGGSNVLGKEERCGLRVGEAKGKVIQYANIHCNGQITRTWVSLTKEVTVAGTGQDSIFDLDIIQTSSRRVHSTINRDLEFQIPELEVRQSSDFILLQKQKIPRIKFTDGRLVIWFMPAIIPQTCNKYQKPANAFPCGQGI